MMKFKAADLKRDFSDNDACLEWLKNQLYPKGIECPNCKKITRHHKSSTKPYYICNVCGDHVHPTAGTIFQKSSTPLKIWFQVIGKMAETKCKVSAREIQREFGVTYKTAWRMVRKSKEFIKENHLLSDDKEILSGVINTESPSIPEMGKDTVLKVSNVSYRECYSGIDTTQDESARKYYSKRDRTARLLKLQMLLSQNPQGLYIEEIANKCSISKRTAYRDLMALESELGVPIWEEGSRRGVTDGYFLPPVNFTLPEAIIIFIAQRTMRKTERIYNPTIASLFTKLNSIVPTPLGKKIQYSLEYVEKQPPEEKRKIDNMNKLMQAWLSQHKVKINYQYRDEEKPLERIIEPRFFEPSITGGLYLIAFCHLKKAVCAFKLKHVVGEVNILPDSYEIPEDFNAEKLLDEAWGVHFENDIETVKLHFKPGEDNSILETYIHPSQTIEALEDGSVIISLKVRDSIRFRNWILGWGDSLEVLEPQTLRNQIRDSIKSLAHIYS